MPCRLRKICGMLYYIVGRICLKHSFFLKCLSHVRVSTCQTILCMKSSNSCRKIWISLNHKKLKVSHPAGKNFTKQTPVWKQVSLHFDRVFLCCNKHSSLEWRENGHSCNPQHFYFLQWVCCECSQWCWFQVACLQAGKAHRALFEDFVTLLPFFISVQVRNHEKRRNNWCGFQNNSESEIYNQTRFHSSCGGHHLP